MIYFRSLKLENYRNFKNFNTYFTPGCNVIIGQNGTGKTNILESISLFEKGKGFRKDNIKNFVNYTSKKKYFKISSVFFDKNNEINLSLFNEINKSSIVKKILINDSSSRDSLKYFENVFSLVYFLPEMERLFLNNPTVRRNFLDRLIYSTDKTYNKLINNYKKCIIERSKILKIFKYDPDWITNLEKKIVELGIQIYQKRIKHISVINSNLKDLDSYNNYSYRLLLFIRDNLVKNDKEDINKIYELYLAKLKNSREFDAVIGGCKIGPHKSDIVGYNIANNFNLNQFSTGQQKTVILLIIIAQCKFLINELKRYPIIMFDEVCSHLDKENRKLLLHLIETLDVQTFISGTEKNFFSFLSTKATYCNINAR